MARFGKYELLRKIGEGGMAEVHLARTTGAFGTEKLLVLKRLLPELAGQPRFVRMFLDEARLALGLSHANIVHVYEADEVDGAPFYVMEFLHGRDVRELMREMTRQRSRLPLEHAVAIVLSTCAALHYAHELVGTDGRPLGIVHRDVSPHNVFVLYDGVVKVIDFGIAKLDASGDRTATGMLKGKFGYMSPEQCLQQPLDRRSDVFCVGILLWELTTAQRLFKAASEYQVVKNIVETSATPPSKVDSSYPRALEAIVVKALKRDRSARYPTARALEVELQAFARTAGLDLSPASLARYMESVFDKDVQTWRRALMTGGPLPPMPVRSRDDDDPEGEATTSGGAPAPRSMGDETKSAAVTETLTPERRGWSRSTIAAAAVALAATVGVITLVARRDDAAPSATAVDSDAPATSATVVAPAIGVGEPAPVVDADAGVAAPSAEASASATASVSPSRKPPVGPRRPKTAPNKPKPAATRDPDAPLPR